MWRDMKSTGKRSRGSPFNHTWQHMKWNAQYCSVRSLVEFRSLENAASVSVCWWVIFRPSSTTRSINSLQNRLEPVSRVPGSIKTNGSINPQEQEQHLFCLHWFGPVRLTAAQTLRGFSGLRIHQPIVHNAPLSFTHSSVCNDWQEVRVCVRVCVCKDYGFVHVKLADSITPISPE